jgi:hypothetical protein
VTFPLRYPARIRSLKHNTLHSAYTVNMTYMTVHLHLEDHLCEVTERVEVAIDWPVLLDERIPLQLILQGYVVWHDRRGFVVHFGSSWELKTRNFKFKSMGVA